MVPRWNAGIHPSQRPAGPAGSQVLLQVSSEEIQGSPCQYDKNSLTHQLLWEFTQSSQDNLQNSSQGSRDPPVPRGVPGTAQLSSCHIPSSVTPSKTPSQTNSSSSGAVSKVTTALITSPVLRTEINLFPRMKSCCWLPAVSPDLRSKLHGKVCRTSAGAGAAPWDCTESQTQTLVPEINLGSLTEAQGGV